MPGAIRWEVAIKEAQQRLEPSSMTVEPLPVTLPAADASVSGSLQQADEWAVVLRSRGSPADADVAVPAARSIQ